VNNRAARIVARVVGIVAILLGALWVGQGLGYLPGSVMSGVRFWFWVGAALVLVGLALLFAARRRTPAPRA
jgi:MYXO-CTERM domain-containing protein